MHDAYWKYPSITLTIFPQKIDRNTENWIIYTFVSHDNWTNDQINFLSLKKSMTSFRFISRISKNEWFGLVLTTPPLLNLPTSRPFWAVNCANEQLWSRAEIVPMFRHNGSVKWTILSSHHLLLDWYVHKNRRSSSTQPNNSHETSGLFDHFYF